MIKVTESEPKITTKKKQIAVSGVAIRGNQLVDLETGDTDVLEKIASELPNGIEEISFKLVFAVPEA